MSTSALCREFTILTTTPLPVRPTSDPANSSGWRTALRTAIRSPGELCKLLGLPQNVASSAGDFAMLVPRSYAARMQPGDPQDPLLRQVLPVADEHQTATGFSTDPVGDAMAQHKPGMLHKYHGRILLVLTGACAVNCRYCFRRHYPYNTSTAGPRQWQAALDTIANDNTLEEVILSGGDPLMLDDSLLAEFAAALEPMQHVRRLRIHTRLPIVIPQRITNQLTDWISNSRLSTIVVVHANHANELDDEVATAMSQLAATGSLLLNQAVLLRGVNDSTDAQRELCQRLIDMNIMPYYLHQLDRVAGASHFEVAVEAGLEIVRQLRAQLPGYAVPRYVQEIAGEPNKRVLA